MADIWALPPEEVYSALNTSPGGLSGRESARRLKEFGPNRIKEIKKTPMAWRFMGHFTHFFALLLWVGAGLSFLGERYQPGEGMAALGLAIIAVIVINAVFTFLQEYKAEKAAEALKKLLPQKVMVLRDGKEDETLAYELVPGDVVLFSEGDLVSADCRLVEQAEMRVNNAPLTGESEPIKRDTGVFEGQVMESPNLVFAGTSVVGGSGKGVVYATGMNTEFGKIAHLTQAVEPEAKPLQKEIVKVTRLVAILATVLGVVFFTSGWLVGRSFWENFLFAIGIIVANVPEGLLPTVTLALAMGSQRMAKKNALIKNLSAVETLGSATVICTDKTGTLTQNRMAVVKAMVSEEIVDIKDVGKGGESRLLLEIAGLCNNARFVKGKVVGDPTEGALLTAASEKLDIEKLKDDRPRIREIPFDPVRKRMTTFHRVRGKEVAYTKGALESVLSICSNISIRGKVVPLTEDIKREIVARNDELAEAALRVLAFAYREGPAKDEEGMTFIGLAGMIDPPRPEVKGAVEKCHGAGIKVIMVTGDQAKTAEAIGRQIGLVRGGNPLLITGQKLAEMDDEELKEELSKEEIIFARMTPKHKMRIVENLKELGEIVAVTGDGVNDAPALKKADIGVAMGIAGTDVAKEAADMILMDDNFASIVAAVEEGRAVFENIRRFVTYIFASNIPEIIPYICYVLLGIPLPLTIIQILAIDLGTDLLPALALGSERPEPGLMERPPRSRKERLLNLEVISRAYFFLGPFEALAGMAGYFKTLFAGGWLWGMKLASSDPLYQKATTMALTAIVVTQVANGLVCRSTKESLFRIGPFTNRLLLWGIVTEIALQVVIVYHSLGHRIFGTMPITFDDWLFFIPFAVLLFVAEETRKAISRRK